MSETIASVIAWLVKNSETADEIAIDEGGIELVLLKDGKETGAYYEVGGIPEEQEE